MLSFHILASGSNARGQLANGTLDDAHSFQLCQFSGPIHPFVHVVQIATGANHTLVLLRDVQGCQRVWGCGDGTKGQLGANFRHVPGATPVLTPIEFDSSHVADLHITHIAAAWETSYVVLSHRSDGADDVLLSMGSDDFGDLGLGTSQKGRTCGFVTFRHLFPALPVISTIRILDIQTGPHTVLAKLSGKRDDGSHEELIVGWGANRHGQLGLLPGAIAAVRSPQVVSFACLSSFALGNQHTITLQHGGHVQGFGSNKKNQLAGMASLSDVRAIGATWNGTYVITEMDDRWSILATGSNAKGQLGRGFTGAGEPALVEVSLPDRVAAQYTVDIACGSEHVLVLLRSRVSAAIASANAPVVNEVWAWGWNEHGNLGLGHTEDVAFPKLVWPPSDTTWPMGSVLRVWGGCGTSWIVVEYELD